MSPSTVPPRGGASPFNIPTSTTTTTANGGNHFRPSSFSSAHTLHTIRGGSGNSSALEDGDEEEEDGEEKFGVVDLVGKREGEGFVVDGKKGGGGRKKGKVMFGSTGRRSSEGRYFDEYDEDEVDRERSMSLDLERRPTTKSLGIKKAHTQPPSRVSSPYPSKPSSRLNGNANGNANVNGVLPKPNRQLTPPTSSTITIISDSPHSSTSSLASTTPLTSSDARALNGSASPIQTLKSTRWYRLTHRPIIRSILIFTLFLLLSLVLLVVLLYFVIPPIGDEDDRSAVKIPKSFEDLKRLNEVLKVWKEKNYVRVMLAWCAVYLFLQAFSIPGSMYLSILAGALFGVPIALPLVCFVVATGALLAYYLSSLLGPAILGASERWRDRVDRWKVKIARAAGGDVDKDGEMKGGWELISYLIVLRISPIPPHWVVNLIAPHLGIGIWPFWISSFFGIMGISFIHCQIGTTLEQMTSPSDFKILSAGNILGLAGIVVAVLVPVGIRRIWGGKALEDAEEAEGVRLDVDLDADDDDGDSAGEESRMLPGPGSGAGAGIRARGRSGDVVISVDSGSTTGRGGSEPNLIRFLDGSTETLNEPLRDWSHRKDVGSGRTAGLEAASSVDMSRVSSVGSINSPPAPAEVDPWKAH